MATIVDVTILGNRYKLKSSDNEARQLEELAAWLDARMQETANRLKRVNPLNVSILTALQLAEELSRGQAEAKAACGRLQTQYNSELARLTKQHDSELTKYKNALATLKRQHDGELAEIRTRQQAEVSLLKEQHSAVVNGMQQKHSQEISGIQQEHCRRYETLQAEHDSLKKDYNELMELLE